MANTVSITFQAEDSSVLRAQKRQKQAEKELQKEMGETARAAENAAKKIEGAKAKAGKPTTAVYGGAHGVSPEVLNPTYWKRQKSSLAMVERSLRGGGGSVPVPSATPMSLGEMNMLAESHERITRGIAARRAMAGREERFAGTARLHGLAQDDLAGITTVRNREASRLRGLRRDEREFRTFIGNRNAQQESLDGINATYDKNMKRAQELQDARRTAADRRAQKRQNLASGALAVGAAVGLVADRAGAELDQLATTILDAEKSMAGAFGVANNSARRGAIRRELVTQSVATGLSIADVSELRGRMESAFEDMPTAAKRAAEKSALDYAKLGVTDVTGTALGLGAAYQYYGKQLGGGEKAMKTLANRLAYSADVGAFDPNQITPYLGNVLGTFQTLGYSDSEAFAALATASKSGMRAETFTTGLRNLPLMLTEAASKGKFKRTGSFAGDVDQLSGLSEAALLDIVGRDAFPVVALMRQNMGTMRGYTNELSRLGPGSDILGQKIGAGLANDPMATTANTLSSARAVQTNAALIQAEDPLLGKAIEEWELREAGAAREFHPMFGWLRQPGVWMETATSGLEGIPGMTSIHSAAARGVLGSKDRLLNIGAREIINQKRAAGENFMADYLSLKYNPDQDQYFTGADGNRVYAGNEDAEMLRDLYKRGYTGVSAGEMMQYRQLVANGGDGEGYLNRVGRGDGSAASSAGAGIDVVKFNEAVGKLAVAADRLAGGGPQTAIPAKDPNRYPQ